MADRFHDQAFNDAITGSGVTGANAIEAKMEEADGSPFVGDDTFTSNPNAFNTSGAILPANDTTLGTNEATGSTEFDKLQWRIDFGSGFIRFFRIDNIGEGTGSNPIENGEDVTVRTGSLDCGTTGLANIIRVGLSSVTVDVEVVDNSGTVQATFNGVSFSWNNSNERFEMDSTQSFQNDTGSSFTIDKIEAFADGDSWFTAQRNDNVPDGANVDITQLRDSITNLS